MPLRREIITTLIVKTLLLTLLWFAFFREDERHAVDADRTARALLAIPASEGNAHDRR